MLDFHDWSYFFLTAKTLKVLITEVSLALWVVHHTEMDFMRVWQVAGRVRSLQQGVVGVLLDGPVHAACFPYTENPFHGL